jgi:hypothetical protein
MQDQADILRANSGFANSGFANLDFANLDFANWRTIPSFAFLTNDA